MAPHITQIITFSTAQAYREDPSVSSLDVFNCLSKSSNLKKPYHGIQIEDPGQGYLVGVFGETELEPGSLLLTIKSSFGSEVESNHVQFTTDPTAALSAPVTEIVFFKLKDGKTRDEIAPYLDVLANQDTKTVISSIWGASLEIKDRIIMLVGWESLEAHKEVVSAPSEEMKALFAHLLELSEFTVGHARLST